MTKSEEAENLNRRGAQVMASDPDEALRLIRESLAIDPNAPFAIYNHVHVLARLGRDDEAVAELSRLEKLAPELGATLRRKLLLSAAPYLDLSRSAYEAGDYEQAFKKCKAALAYDPSYADAWVVKGICLERLGRADEAPDCYTKAIELENDNFFAWANRGEWRLKRQEWRAAVDDLTRAIDLDPKYADGYRSRANAFDALGMSKEATADRATAEAIAAESDPGA